MLNETHYHLANRKQFPTNNYHTQGLIMNRLTLLRNTNKICRPCVEVTEYKLLVSSIEYRA